MIVARLDIPDLICLALASKSYAQIVLLGSLAFDVGPQPIVGLWVKHWAQFVSNYKGLGMSRLLNGAEIHWGRVPDEAEILWGNVMERLEMGWMSKDYRRCHHYQCNVFRPVSLMYWRDKLEAGKQGEKKKGGLVSWKWIQAAEKSSDFWSEVYEWRCGNHSSCPRCWVRGLRTPWQIKRDRKDYAMEPERKLRVDQKFVGWLAHRERWFAQLAQQV